MTPDPVGTRARPRVERRNCRPGALDGYAPRPGPASAGAHRKPGPQHGAGAGAPLAGVARREAAAGAPDSRGRTRGPWPPTWTSPRWPTSPASSTEAAAEAAIAEQGDGPLDVRAVECAVAGGYGGDTCGGRRRDGVDRRDDPPGRCRRAAAAQPSPRAHDRRAARASTASAGWCADGSDGGDPRSRDRPPRPFRQRPTPPSYPPALTADAPADRTQPPGRAPAPTP